MKLGRSADRTRKESVLKNPLYRYQHFVALVWICIAGAVNARESSCDLGVYVGKIGSIPVTISLDERRIGSMYYRVNMIDMVLKQETMQPVWIEFDGDNKPSGRIKLTCNDKQLIGEWNSIDDKKHFPVVASRSPDDDYNARRFSALTPIKTPKLAQDRSRSFPITGPKILGSDKPVIHGIQLFGTEPGLAKINRLLWKDLLANTESILGCSLEFRQRFGENPGALDFNQHLLHTAGPYAIVNSDIGFECGDGMRIGKTTTTYRLTDGQKVDSSQWFKEELNALWKEDWRTTPLTTLILKAGRTQKDKDLAECFKAAEYSLSDVYPSRVGLVFIGSLPTPFQFCQGTADVTLPYSHLAPFMSAEGKRVVQEIGKMPKP